MPKRAFLLLVFPLLGLLVATNFLSRLLPQKETSLNTVTPTITLTATATATPDPFAGVPTATPYGEMSDRVQILPTLAPLATSMPTQLSTASPTPTSLPQPTRAPLSLILPDTSSATGKALPASVTLSADAHAPTRILIPRLNLDAPVEAVGMLPSSAAPGVFEWGVPDTRAAGWLNTTAPFGVPGNTVLDGHHNIKGEVFRNLWTLRAGDEITLFAGAVSRRYRVQDLLILPEKGQSIEVRLRNAQYIAPTPDERLTLVTCYPYESNTHRVVVVALPQ